MAEHAIEAQGLVRVFKKGPRAVDGIDLAVAPGEIYGFLGPNGAGKSTTVHVLTTLLPPTEGNARVAGYDVVREGPQVRAAIGAALQEAALDPLLTGREHLRLQASLQALPRETRRVRADELLHRLGLTEAADRNGAAAILARFGKPCGSERAVAVRLESGETDLSGLVRALDAEHLKVEHLQLHQPSLDVVFLAKTGRSLEGAAEEEEERARGGLAMEPA